MKRPESDENETASEIAANDDDEPFFALRDVEGRTLMLEVLLRTGNSHAFPYAYLLGVTFDPSIGITLHFTNAKVLLRGRNLRALHQGLLTHRVLWLREGNSSEAFLPESRTFISQVEVHYR
jgi:hypothetical protein